MDESVSEQLEEQRVKRDPNSEREASGEKNNRYRVILDRSNVTHEESVLEVSTDEQSEE